RYRVRAQLVPDAGNARAEHLGGGGDGAESLSRIGAEQIRAKKCVRGREAPHFLIAQGRRRAVSSPGVQGSVCTAAILSRSCPLWVISGHCAVSDRCPLYPQKRTLPPDRPMSAMCQKRTLRDIRSPNRRASGTST